MTYFDRKEPVAMWCYTVLCVFGLYIGAILATEDWHFTGINVALNKPTSQSPGTYSGTIPGQWPPVTVNYTSNLAVDGNTNTNFSGLSCSCTNGNDEAASWTVDLGRPYYITGIRIYNRNDHRSRLESFKVLGYSGTRHIFIYEDINHNPRQFNNEVISIEIDGRQPFETITILIPKRSRKWEGVNLPLCEVQIFQGSERHGCDFINTIGYITASVVPGTGMRTDSKIDVGTVITFTCPRGYIVDGPTAVMCLDTGNYNNTLPKRCKQAICERPVTAHGSYAESKSQFVQGQKITLVCSDGYKATSSFTIRVCQSDHSWSNGNIQCKQNGCQSTPELTNGGYNTSNRKFDYGTTIQASCNTGYYLQGNHTVTCIPPGRWSHTPTCLKITCNYPGTIAHGFYTKPRVGGNRVNSDVSQRFRFRQRLYVNCYKGYKRSGSEQWRQCTRRNYWDGSQPICTRITCPIPTTDSNIRFTDNNDRLLPNRIQYGEIVRASCTSYQYRLTGSPSRSCGANGEFNGTAPLCVATCDRPITAYGTYSNNNTQFVQGQSITLVCNDGYNATSSNTTRVCQNDHTWSNSNIQCRQNGCQSTPELTNGGYHTSNRQFDYGATIRASCDVGYYLQGNNTVTCITPGHWSHTPTCSQITCNNPGAIVNGFYSKPRVGGNRVISDVSRRFRFLQRLYVHCNKGYKRSGSELWRQCTGRNSWSGLQPICTRITCQIPSATSNIHFIYNKDRLLHYRIQYGETVIANCTNGQFKLTGRSSRSCGANEMFIGIAPSCVAICKRPVVSYGSYLNNVNQFVKGQTITLLCNEGYEATSSNTKRFCQTDHSWSNGDLQCNPKRCNIQPIKNASYNVTSTYIEFPEAVTFECKKGFKMINGSKIRTCQSNKRMSGINPVCKEIFCSTNNFNPDNNHYKLINNSNNSNRIRYNEVIQSTCKEGYERESGSETRTCIDDDKFKEPEISCRVIHCSTPPIVFKGAYNITAEDLTNLTNISFSCSNGYTQTKGNSIRLCQTDQTWSGDEPVCIAKRCAIRSISNGSYNVTSSFIEFPDAVSFECKRGLKITTGAINRTCQYDGTLSGTEPVCKKIFCSANKLYPDKHHYVMVTKLTNLHRIGYNTMIQTSCKEGYKRVNGSETRTCIDDDKFNEPELSCQVIHCLQPPSVLQGAYNITAKDLTYLTNISFSCYNGYMQTKGGTSRFCQLDRTWSGEEPVCIAIESTSDQQSSHIPVIVGLAASVGILIVIVIVIGVILFRRRGLNSKQATKECNTAMASTRPGPSNTDSEYAEIDETNLADSINLYTTPEPPLSSPHYYTTLELSEQAYYSFSNPDKMPKRAIRVIELSNLVFNEDKARDKLQKEFEDLPTEMKEKHSAALKHKNKAKSRYKNVYAYDATRVVLDVSAAKSETDYINANFVHGFNKVQAYVASQGATKETINDFWRMVWQLDCGKIVMLTNIIEENKEKCKQYWPTSDRMTFGKIEVTLKKTEMFSDFVIRTLAVCRENTDNVKEISQFHFTAWPEKGVPKYASSLVNFRNKVKHMPCEMEGPIVVHCSAGIGRTGTFIALDYLTDQALALGYVDVAGCVETIRKQRVNLVQTLDQYIFIHHALVETLMLSPTAMPAAQFPAAYKDMLQYDDVQKKRKIDIAFEMLKKRSPVADEFQYVSAKHVRNRNKNRYSNILPVAEFMPTLSFTGKQSDSNYINAVFLPSYKVRKAFIITQTPMEYTLHDFWRLLYEHDVHSVVMLNDVMEIKDTEVYWPDEGKEMIFRDIKVTNDGSESSEDQLVTTLKMNKFEKTRTIKQFRCQNWVPTATLPKDPSAMLQLMELVQNWQQQTGNHPVVVHCMNGAERSGLFCVISAAIERMKIEQDVAITQVIEQMRNNREQIISSQEQFQFCHEAVITFMEQNKTYSNFTTLKTM